MDWTVAESIDYWRQLNPDLPISAGRDPETVSRWQPSPTFIAEWRRRIIREGYFELTDVIPPEDLHVLVGAIDRVRAAGWLPVFAFLYDAFWETYWRVSPVLSLLLGDDYRQIPAFWAWHIDPVDTAQGWGPHRDRGFGHQRPDRTPNAMTVWMALTDATPLNGCISVVPAHLDLTPINPGLTNGMQDARALPAKAGTALCWGLGLLHWGGRSSDYASHPRVSMTFEFQAADTPALEPFLLQPGEIPPFEKRLALVCMQLMAYNHRTHLPAADMAIAEAIRYAGLPR